MKYNIKNRKIIVKLFSIDISYFSIPFTAIKESIGDYGNRSPISTDILLKYYTNYNQVNMYHSHNKIASTFSNYLKELNKNIFS